MDNRTVSYRGPQLWGTFYPEYDIPVILLLSFICTTGLGNWVIFWCFIKTKALRNPFNIIVLALAFSNGLVTTAISPMELARVAMLYRPVSPIWCNAKIIMKTFCFTVSLLTISTIATMRLITAIRAKSLKLSYTNMSFVVITILGLSVLTSPVLLNENSATYINCMGQVDVDRIREVLKQKGYIFATDQVRMSAAITTQASVITETPDIWTTESPVNEGVNTSVKIQYLENATVANEANLPTALWKYYFCVAIILFTETIVCYVCLLIILKKRQHQLQGLTLGSNMDILTLRITIYVTCTFILSFLIPFLPAIVVLPPGFGPEVLHYTAIFHSLSSLDGALTPIIYYFLNPLYKKSLIRALPAWLKKVCCRIKVFPAVQGESPGVVHPIHVHPKTLVVPVVLQPREPYSYGI